MSQTFSVKAGYRQCLNPVCTLIGGTFFARWMDDAKPVCTTCGTNNNISVEVTNVGKGILRRKEGEAAIYREPDLHPDFKNLAPPMFQANNFQEFYQNRKETSHQSVGLDDQDKVVLKDNPARVLHEEVDSHTGTVELWLQENSQTDSGTIIQKWEPTAKRRLTKTDQKKTRD